MLPKLCSLCTRPILYADYRRHRNHQCNRHRPHAHPSSCFFRGKEVAALHAFKCLSYLSVAIYAARSAASVRDSPIFGIFGCGSSKKNANLAASKSCLFAMVANGGASPVGARWFDATTWHGAHHRRASRSPLSWSAPNAGVMATIAAAIRH